MSNKELLVKIEEGIVGGNKTLSSAMYFLLCVLGIFAVWIIVPSVLYTLIAYRYEDGKIPPEIGVVGDFFGSVNALFAGLAFLLILISVRQGQRNLKAQQKSLETQQEELRLQREELQESRKVLSDQADSQSKMIEAIHRLAKDTRESAILSAHCSVMESSNRNMNNSPGIADVKGRIKAFETED